MKCYRYYISVVSLLIGQFCFSQSDSTIQALQKIPLKYISSIDKKVDKYSRRVTSKTEKTLEKLSRWENKIKDILEKVSPATAQQLFAQGQQTFGSVLQRIKEGNSAMESYHSKYDQYRDKLTTDLKYLSTQKANLDQKILKPLAAAKKKVEDLSEKMDDTEELEKFMKERKKQLINTSIQYIGKSKYLAKINKETFYYVESMKNYKAIFSDPAKAEETAKTILNKIPTFQSFFQKNSMLASLFSVPENYASLASFTGLQTRASVQSLIQGRIAPGGSAMQQVRQSMQQARGQLDNLKKKLLDPFFGNGGGSLPDFKPNMQKTKTFKQRLEYGSNIQYSKNSLVPTTMDLAFTIGYKLNDKSVAGVGGSYKIGLGTIQHINISNQGASVRSFIDWKLKKQFFVTGGMEMNYLAALPDNDPMLLQRNISNWQQSGLVGLSKKISIKNKLFKETKLQLLYDFLSSQHVPISQPILFRVGYNF